MRAALVIAAAALAGSAYVLYAKQREAASAAEDSSEYSTQEYDLGVFGELANEAAQETAELIDSLTGGTMKLSAMARVTGGDVANPNVQAFLRVIRRGEGTGGENGYRTLFGGGLFSSFAAHPDTLIVKSGYRSTAAGAYQFLTSTWNETARAMGLADFSPASQDRGAVGRIAARGALDDVKAGRFESAIRKCAKEWASLPYSPYGQPTISMSVASSVFAQAGGVVSA